MPSSIVTEFFLSVMDKEVYQTYLNLLHAYLHKLSAVFIRWQEESTRGLCHTGLPLIQYDRRKPPTTFTRSSTVESTRLDSKLIKDGQ